MYKKRVYMFVSFLKNVSPLLLYEVGMTLIVSTYIKYLSKIDYFNMAAASIRITTTYTFMF